MNSSTKRLVVLISGRGSNMVSLLQACRGGRINGDIVAVISNRADAAGLELARQQGIATAVVDHRAHPSREDFDRDLYTEVARHRPDLVILAGFMRILTPEFVRPLTGRLLNIHPSLLPKYPGLNTHQRAIDAGDSEAGATVHYVTEELDGGPAIIQARVAVLPDDTPQTLANRILEREHLIYEEAVRLICDQRVTYAPDGRVLLDGAALTEGGIQFGEPSGQNSLQGGV